MTMRVNRETYESMIAEDLAWLHTCPDSLERQHIECVLRTSAERIYAAPPPPVLVVTDEACEIVWWYRIEHQNPSATAPMVAREWLTAWQRELGPTLGLVTREECDNCAGVRAEIARAANSLMTDRITELEAALTERDTEIVRLRDALDLSALEYADLTVSAKSLEEHLSALVEVSEKSTIALARAALNGDDEEGEDEDAALAGNGGEM